MAFGKRSTTYRGTIFLKVRMKIKQHLKFSPLRHGYFVQGLTVARGFLEDIVTPAFEAACCLG